MFQTLGSGVWKWETKKGFYSCLQGIASAVTLSLLFHLLKSTWKKRSKKSQTDWESKESDLVGHGSLSLSPSQTSLFCANMFIEVAPHGIFYPVVSYLVGQTLSPLSSVVAHWRMRAVRIVFSDNIWGYVWLICLLDDEVWCLLGIPFERDLKMKHHAYSARLPGSSTPSSLITFYAFFLKRSHCVNQERNLF